MKFPEPCTLRTALCTHVDLHKCPKAETLAVLSGFASVPAERDRLLHLSKPENRVRFAHACQTRVTCVPWMCRRCPI
jgi:hypothetical protein